MLQILHFPSTLIFNLNACEFNLKISVGELSILKSRENGNFTDICHLQNISISIEMMMIKNYFGYFRHLTSHGQHFILPYLLCIRLYANEWPFIFLAFKCKKGKIIWMGFMLTCSTRCSRLCHCKHQFGHLFWNALMVFFNCNWKCINTMWVHLHNLAFDKHKIESDDIVVELHFIKIMLGMFVVLF